MWLLLELVMPPKKPKISTFKVGPSAAIAVATEVEAALGVREQTPKSDIEEVEIDQNGDEIEEDEDGKITEQARNLKTLNQY
jgi:hypothetical protein